MYTIPQTTGEFVVTHTPAITTKTRWTYGSGGAAYGVFYNSHYFVLAYYSQVLGLNPALAGFAITLGLVLDAITDPLIGYLSDNTKSRWGRRHPWLIASIAPFAASFFLLWHPPAAVGTGAGLFIWLVICNITMRTAITMFLVPAYAMVAELTSSYEERTRLFTWFHVGYAVFANGMSVLMYAIWLVPTDDIKDGVLNPAGYQDAGVFGTVVIVASILIFTLGTRHFIPRLKEYEIKEALRPLQFYRQVIDVFRTRSARMVVAGGIGYYVGTGTYVALWVYIYSYFWEFTSEQISVIVIPMALAALVLPPLWGVWAKGRDKKSLAMFGLGGAMVINLIPITLRLIGWFPENGTETLFWTMTVLGFFETNLFLVFDICWRSMIADLTERTEIETGRRNEGVIASTVTFVTKSADAIGTLLAGILLLWIAFPTETEIGQVPQDTVNGLGLIYGPLVCAIWLGAIFVLSRYRIDRSRHERMVKQLGR